MCRLPTTAHAWTTGGHFSRVIVTEGDSVTQAQSAYGYVYVGAAATSPKWYLRDIAIGGSNLDTNTLINGSTWGDLTYRATDYTDAFLASTPGALRVLYVNIGTNNISPTAADFAVRYGNYLLARRAAGWDKIVVGTLLSRSDEPFVSTGHEDRRLALNDIIRSSAWKSAYGVDAVADMASDPTIGPFSSHADHPELWLDTVHPSAAGHALMAPYFTAALNSIA